MASLNHSSLSAKILKAMSIFSGVQAFGIICSIIRTKLISLWIGTTGVGLFAIFNSVLELLSTASQLNLRESAVRDISSTANNRLPFIAGVVRWWGRRLGILGAILMIIFSPILSLISFGDTTHWLSFALLALAVFGLAVTNSEQAIMQGSSQLKLLARSSLLGGLFGTLVSIPLYYFLRYDSIIPSIIIFSIAGALVTSILSNVKSAKSTKRDTINTGKGFLKLGLYLTVSSVVSTAASYIFVSYLNTSASTEVTGLFQSGYTLVIRYTGIIFTALSMEYFPRITRIAMRPRQASIVVSHELALVLYILTPLLVIFIMADELAVRILYTESFLAMLPFVTIGIGAMIFRATSYCMAYVIIGRGDGKTYVITEVASSIIGLALNILLFKHFGFIGLGISYILWYMIYTVIIGIVYHNYGMRLSSGAIKLVAVSSAIVALSIAAKHWGWLAVTPLVAASLTLSYKGYVYIIKRKH